MTLESAVYFVLVRRGGVEGFRGELFRIVSFVLVVLCFLRSGADTTTTSSSSVSPSEVPGLPFASRVRTLRGFSVRVIVGVVVSTVQSSIRFRFSPNRVRVGVGLVAPGSGCDIDIGTCSSYDGGGPMF